MPLARQGPALVAVLAVNGGLVVGVRRGLAIRVGVAFSGLADAGSPRALPLGAGHGSDGVAALVHVMRALGGHNSTVHVHGHIELEHLQKDVQVGTRDDQGFDACLNFLADPTTSEGLLVASSTSCPRSASFRSSCIQVEPPVDRREGPRKRAQWPVECPAIMWKSGWNPVVISASYGYTISMNLSVVISAHH